MSRIDDITQGELRALLKRIAALEKATPLASASVGNGRLRFYNGSQLLIEDGNLTVSGTGEITGTLNVTGTLGVSGAANITGPLTVTGVTKLNGDTTINGPSHVVGNQDITGTLAVKGITTLSKDLNVVTGGKIKLGSGMQLEPFGAGGGAISFLPTGSIAAGSGTISIVPPDVSCTLIVGNSGTLISGNLNLTSLPLNAGKTPNLYIDSAGKVWRTS